MALPNLPECLETLPSVTHYQVLGLNPAMLDSSTAADAAPLIKRAYRRALLRNHPDKTTSTPAVRLSSFCTPRPASSHIPTSASSSPHSLPLHHPTATVALYSVDQISQAFAVLSSPSRRAAYNASLESLARVPLSDACDQAHFSTGVENVDLDDLDFDDAQAHWHRSCRCGNSRGYSLDETDLLAAADDGLLMVGCHDCSLWLRVHFALVQQEGPDGSTNSNR